MSARPSAQARAHSRGARTRRTDHPVHLPLDCLAGLGAALLRAPMALITSTAGGGAILGATGLAEPCASTRQLPPPPSPWQHVAETGAPLAMADVRRETRFGKALLAEPEFIAFAGAPVRGRDGRVIGTACVLDSLARDWTVREIRLVEELAIVAAAAMAGSVDEAREQTDVALRRSEARLSSIVAHALEAIVAVDAEQRIVLFNEAAERMFGCSAAEVIGGTLDRFIPEAARGVHRHHIERFAASGITTRQMAHRGTLWAVRATGETFPIDASISQSGEGAAKLYTIILDDISERYQAEAALKESEERLRLVVRATNEIIWEWDITTGELTWSEDACKAFRYAPEELGQSIEWWYDKIHPEEREAVITGLNTLMGGTGEVWSDEYRFLRGDGSYATVLDRGYVRRDERGVPQTAIGAMMDVTERRRGEQAQRFLSQASALLDSSLDPEITLPGVARLLVPAYADLCRIDLLEEDGSSRLAAVAHAVPTKEGLVSLGDRLARNNSVHASPIAQAVCAGESILISAAPGHELQRLGEPSRFREYWEQLNAHSVLAVPLMAHDKVLGGLSMGMSESDRQYGPMDLMLAEDLGRRIGIALENAGLYRKAQRAIRAREDILSVVSHDLRNPLSTVRMSVGLLREQAGPDDGSSKWLGMIDRAAAHMDRMIGDLLDAARIDAGGFTIVPAAHDVGALLAEVRDNYGPAADAQNLTLQCDCAVAGTQVLVDAPQIQRVLGNLLGNALKFTPPAGVITVTADEVDGMMRFAVSNSGDGIPAEELPHVFSRYWQARRGDRRGVGLGLAIAQGIVAAHRGRIWVESEPHKITTFFFTVPITAAR